MDVSAIQRESVEKFIVLVSEMTNRALSVVSETENSTSLEPLPEPPSKNDFGISARGAEEFVVAWLKSRGFLDAKSTPFTRDGGVDVTTREWVIQVKLYSTKNVSVQEVREIVGVSSTLNKRPAVFTSSGLTLEANKFAEVARVAVVHFDSYSARFEAANDLAKNLFLPPEHDAEYRISYQNTLHHNSELANCIFPVASSARSLVATINYVEKIVDIKDFDFEIRCSEALRNPNYLNSLTLSENKKFSGLLQAEALRLKNEALRLIKKSIEVLDGLG